MSNEKEKIPVNISADTERDVVNETRGIVVALKNFKDAIMELPTKKIRILSDWIVKWATLLRKEGSFRPNSLKKYRQREIILVDFGFNIDGEFGGRHYAVVLERNNNPKSSVILVAPITSYEIGQSVHPTNVDLGIRAINNYEKGAAVIVNQIRNISKMRIEKPKTSTEPRLYMDNDKFQELLDKIHKQLILDT